MNTQLLIDAVMRQTTVLVAELATARGARTPLADIAGQVFSDLSQELHRQGVSRKVAADMFGMALRTYRRKVQRLGESETFAGRSLWEAVHDYLREREVANQTEVLTRFHRDDEAIVKGVLQDLVESGLVFRAGRGASSAYRVATRTDLEHARSAEKDPERAELLLWALIFRLGPIDRGKLGAHVALPGSELDDTLARLVKNGRVRRTDGTDTYRADAFVAPLGQAHGWEASVFDHFQAMVTTIVQKLRSDADAPTHADRVGGSTYTLEVWPGHALEQEVLGELSAFRKRLGDLRERVQAHNRRGAVPARRSKVIVYGGQCVLEHDDESEDSRVEE